MHTTVLLHEVITYLNLQKGDIVLDATVNGGGHSEEIVRELIKHGGGRLIGIDQDRSALARARMRLAPYEKNVVLVRENFRNLDRTIDGCGISTVNKIVFDLGLSTDQLENSGRGFSFQSDEPLLMTFDDSPGLENTTARDVVNNWDEKHIADILYGFGGERFSRRIAHAIVARRTEHPITTSRDLADIVVHAMPFWAQRGSNIHPATKTFQAIRIAVNDEYGSLAEALDKAIDYLAPGGRCAIIAFHSGEDRIVKRAFKKYVGQGKIKLITKKPVVPTDMEIKNNPRARSAKLRVCEKI